MQYLRSFKVFQVRAEGGGGYRRGQIMVFSPPQGQALVPGPLEDSS